MPRYSVLTSAGRTIAKGIYHLPHLEFIGTHDGHSLVPAGSFIVERDLERSGWTTHANNGIYLCHRDVFDLPRTGRYQGCCGPDGETKNVLDAGTLEPIAYEFADCWCAHYIRLARGDYSLKEESPEQPECFVAYIQYRGKRNLVGAACGRTEKETLTRLMALAQHRLQQEARYTSEYHQIVHSPIVTERAPTFLAQLHGEKLVWLFRKY